MPDDERSGNETTERNEETPDVEGHGAKQVVGVGLAAAALIGSGAAAVKLTDDDSSNRTPAALSAKEAGDPKAADRDGDGYVSYSELAHEGFKFNVDELNREGSAISALGLSAAGWKLRLDALGEDGFMIKGESIYMKWGVDENLDKLRESAAEWTKKVRSLDRDGDGYAAASDLGRAGFKYNVDELNKAGVKLAPTDLAKAGYKLPLETLGAGGFMIKGESIFVKQGVDAQLDALVDKH